MRLPTWLYCKDGSAEIVRDQAKYEARIAEGWKDSPARFTEEALAAEKAAAEKAAAEKAAAEKEAASTPTLEPVKEPEPVKVQSPKAPVKKAVKKAVHNTSADDLI